MFWRRRCRRVVDLKLPKKQYVRKMTKTYIQLTVKYKFLTII